MTWKTVDVTQDVHHLGQDPVLAGIPIGVGIGGQGQLSVLPDAIRDPPLHGGVVLEVPVHAPVVAVVGKIGQSGFQAPLSEALTMAMVVRLFVSHGAAPTGGPWCQASEAAMACY
jgi:hypothetical protein